MTICANGSSLAERLGEVRNVKGASWQEDIGLAAEAVLRAENGPCVVFDDIPGCPKGFRVLLNMFAGTRRNMTLGFPDHLNKWELSDAYRDAYLKDPHIIPHEIVDDGPVLENVLMGDDIDVDQIPLADLAREGRRPLYRHRHLQHHPRSRGELAQCRRLSRQVHDKNIGRLRHRARAITATSIARNISRAASRCRSSMVLGGDPLAFFYGGIEAPYGVFELDIVGGMRGRPIKMVRGKVTGLPFPADAEIVLEGYVTPDKRHDRRPVRRMDRPLCRRRDAWSPVLDIKAIYHRNDPILLGVPPMGGGPGRDGALSRRACARP